MAADSSGVVGLWPAVWWTMAKASSLAYCGFARTIDSSAPQAERGMICGVPAIVSRRAGRAGLQTKYALSREALPLNLY